MGIIDDIKYKFINQQDAVKRIIMLNVLVFVVLMLPHVVLFLAQIDTSSYHWFLNKLKLPASFGILLMQPWSIFTYMFLHDGIFHILFNMLWLYWIGTVFQEYLGNRKVYECYFVGGLAGGLIFMISYNIFPVFSQVAHSAHAVGASAGVLAIIVATATLLPDYTINLMFFGNVKLKYIALITVLLDVLMIPQSNAGGHIAHLGGAATGFLYVKYIYKYGNIFPNSFANLFGNKSKMKVHFRNTEPTSSKFEQPTQEEVDRILDKISKHGYDSLSKKEKEILFKASKD
jgi:membrane associated rhomboid family serine protease